MVIGGVVPGDVGVVIGGVVPGVVPGDVGVVIGGVVPGVVPGDVGVVVGGVVPGYEEDPGVPSLPTTPPSLILYGIPARLAKFFRIFVDT